MQQKPLITTAQSITQLEGNIVLMPSLFRETMEMIFESYELFELHDATAEKYIPSHIQALADSEMSRITMRLTGVMAWLMARKAIASGHADVASVVADYRLEGDEYCLKSNSLLEGLLPEYLVNLLDRSLALYQRVWRLDQQVQPAQLELDIA